MLINENIKSITCTDFRIFLKKLVKDKIEKEWTEDFVDQINFINIPRMTIRRRYENKGIEKTFFELNFFEANLLVLIIIFALYSPFLY